MSLLRSSLLPRMLLCIFGVLSLLLFFSDLASIRAYGLSPDSLSMGFFAALLACACFWAGIGKTTIFMDR